MLIISRTPLNETWLLKKQLSFKLCSQLIDDVYEKAFKEGALCSPYGIVAGGAGATF